MIWLIAAGCTITRDIPVAHIVMFDEEGNQLDPEGNPLGWFVPYDRLRGDRRRDYNHRIFDSILSSGKRDILIHIHGGMNEQHATIQRAHDILERNCPRCAEETEAPAHAHTLGDYYPIFVCWKSSLINCYLSHLLFIRGGRNLLESDWADRWLLFPSIGILGSPLYLAIDLARGAIRSPLNYVTAPYNFFRAGHKEARHQEIANELKREGYDISHGEDELSLPQRTADNISLVATLPFKAAGAFFNESLGGSAWNIMFRRSRLLFHRDREFRSYDPEDHEPESSAAGGDGGLDSNLNGGLAKFLADLDKEILERYREEDGRGRFRITIVAHSMGTIVADELLRHLRTAPRFDIDAIVYMAAACSIRDYESSVIPYLEAHPHTHVHHLMLHPRAERGERYLNFGRDWYGLDLWQRGTLLHWVDEYLANPHTNMDRTAGSYQNIAPVIGTLHSRALRERIHFKVFPIGARYRGIYPLAHGDFNDLPFWERELWTPTR